MFIFLCICVHNTLNYNNKRCRPSITTNKTSTHPSRHFVVTPQHQSHQHVVTSSLPYYITTAKDCLRHNNTRQTLHVRTLIKDRQSLNIIFVQLFVFHFMESKLPFDSIHLFQRKLSTIFTRHFHFIRSSIHQPIIHYIYPNLHYINTFYPLPPYSFEKVGESMYVI